MNPFVFVRHVAVRSVATALLTVAGIGIGAAANAADRWVASTGADSGTCAVQASPCQTISYAIGQANPNDKINIASGQYTSPLSITKDGLQLVGATPKPQIKRVSGGTNQALLVINNVRNVRVENIEFAIDQSFVAEGVIASGFVDGLAIVGNNFVQSKSSPSADATYKWRNAISINDNNSQAIGSAPGSNVSITGNTISGLGPNGASLRSGVDMDGGVGTISGNTITTGVHDIRVRFSGTTGASSGTATLIDNNTLNGRGLEIDSPNSSAGTITISNNQINATAGINGTTVYPADFSIMRMIANEQNVPVTVSGNIFAGYQGNYRGVVISSFPNTTFTGNTFTPAAGANNFTSLVVSNKALNTNAATAPQQMTLAARGNIFNGSGVAGAGRAVEFLNDNDAGGTATFGSLIFGGTAPGETNSFDSNLRFYFRLDDYSCETAQASGGSPLCTAPPLPNYSGAIGSVASTNTKVRPFRGNVSATNNLFGGQAPSPATANAVLARTYDKMANPALGMVDYGLVATQLVVYVDDDFSGAYGDSNSFPFAIPTGACAPTTAYFGIDAFKTIAEGLTHVVAGGTVCVAKGAYAESVSLTQRVQLIGDGAGGGETELSQGLTIAASGTSSADRLLIQNLRVSDPASNQSGILVTAQSHLELRGLALVGNGNSGINFSMNAQDVVIADSLLSDNQSTGLRTSSTTNVADVAISNTTFRNNGNVGLLLFGGSNGTGSATNWTITGSQFQSNDNTDTTSFGGGIWLDSFGPSTTIDGFSITNSVFADNGSAPASQFKRGGIAVFASGGGVLKNVIICGNTFSENAGTPGTQKNGIVVSDSTNNTGYQPITVCANNQFIGTDHSISGLAQYLALGSQPVVNITGGAIANTEYINGLVTRVRDNAKFTSITAAMNSLGTLNNDTLQAPVGLYHEKVTFTHAGMSLIGAGPGTVIDGTGLVGNGVTIPGLQNATVTQLTVRNFTQLDPSEGACIYGGDNSSGLSVTSTVISGCRAGRGGIYVNGLSDVSNLTLSGNDVSNSDGRGIVVWNGRKTNLAINNNVIHDITGSGGIGIQDGTASNVSISGNTISSTGDSGIFALGLDGTAGAVTIANNDVAISGRYGIQLLNPNGNGAASGAGSIVVQGNNVSLSALPANVDDIAGISVARRYVAAGGVDNPNGVVITGNTVSGWQSNAARPGNDGFGIALEGTGSRVFGNTLSNNDFGVQFQSGNAGYPGDSNQALKNDYFSRGDAPTTCSALGTNTYSGNATNTRSVTTPAGQNITQSVQNTTRGTNFCTIQAAIDAATTQNGDTIAVSAGNYPEDVVVNKGVILRGPFTGTPGSDSSRSGAGEAVINPTSPTTGSGAAVKILANNVTFDGFTISNVNNTAIASGGNFGGAASNATIINNRIVDVHAGNGIYTNGPYPAASGWTISHNLVRNVESSIGSGINYWAASGGSVSDNTVQQIGFAGIQIVSSSNVQVSANTISDTARSGINVGVNTGGTADGNAFSGNTLSNVNSSGDAMSGALMLSAGVSNVSFTCNAVSGGGTNGFVTGTASVATPGVRVFHNAFTVAGDISHNQSAPIVIGSNWYGGGAASVNGTNAAGAKVATPLPANPIGNALCGDNTTIGSLLAVSGTPQTTNINAPFAAPLEARVVDQLGGAIAGAPVTFTAPAAGASATLGTPSGTTNFDGRFSTTATANANAGSYSVIASSGSRTAAFMLSNFGMANIALTLNGPATAVAGTATPGYTAQLSNTGSALSENVLVNFVISRSAGLVAGDITLEYDTGSGYAVIPLSACGSSLCGSFGPPGVGFPISASYNATNLLRFTSNRSGAITLAASVDGVNTQTSYANSALTVSVAAQGTNIAANGPTSFSGTVSQPIAGPLPSVLVTDSNGNPVADVSVTFTASANSGTLSGAMQITGSNGIATLGGWVLGPTAPNQTVTATAAGVTGSVLFTATADGSVVLSVSVDSGRQFVRAGQSISHLVVIGNSGSLPATGVTLTSTIPPELDSASLSWICVASAGSSCGTPTSGSGNLPTTIDVAGGGSVSFLLIGTVLSGPTDFLTYAVGATRPAGTTGSNASDTHTTTIVIFRNGFEEGSDGAQGIAGYGDLVQMTLESNQLAVFTLADSSVAAGRISTLVTGAGGSFRIEGTWINGQVWLRLVTRVETGELSSGWKAIDRSASQIGISYEPDLASGPRVMVFVEALEIDQPVEALREMSLVVATARNASAQ